MNILETTDICVSYKQGIRHEPFKAVDNVSFALKSGELLGLVGESGCGKSTLSRAIMGLERPSAGAITLMGKPLSYPYGKDVYRTLQMVFQMPRDSFDPKRSIGNAITGIQTNLGTPKDEARTRTCKLLSCVGLDASYEKKYPHQLSGGECQRAAIARALSVSPKVLICDEITSALDVSVQAQVVELLMESCTKTETAVLFISHDIALVQGICSRIMVMHQGSIVEEGAAREVTQNPQSEHTKQLLEAVL